MYVYIPSFRLRNEEEGRRGKKFAHAGVNSFDPINTVEETACRFKNRLKVSSLEMFVMTLWFFCIWHKIRADFAVLLLVFYFILKCEVDGCDDGEILNVEDVNGA